MKKSHTAAVLAFLSVVLLSLGCSDKPPRREHIPAIKKQIYAVQEAVKTKDTAALDSLVTSEMVSRGTVDSLLQFVYGPDGEFPFTRFGDCEIIYTNDKARADCFVMDSTAQKNRPIILTFVYKDKTWLLKGFRAGVNRDSTEVPPTE